MEMGQGVRTGIGASPVSYRHNFLAIWTRWNFIIVLNGSEKNRFNNYLYLSEFCKPN